MNPKKWTLASALLLAMFPACDLHIDVTDDGKDSEDDGDDADDADEGEEGGESGEGTGGDGDPGDASATSSTGTSGDDAYPGDTASSAGTGSTSGDDADPSAGGTSSTSTTVGDAGDAGNALPGEEAAAACGIDIVEADVDTSFVCECDGCSLHFANITWELAEEVLNACDCICDAAGCGASNSGGEGGEG
jgi:hypothetical protein